MKLYNSPNAEVMALETADIVTLSLWSIFDFDNDKNDKDLSSFFTGSTSEGGDMQ